MPSRELSMFVGTITIVAVALIAGPAFVPVIAYALVFVEHCMSSAEEAGN